MRNRTSPANCPQHARQEDPAEHEVNGSPCITEVRNLRHSFSLATGLLQELVILAPDPDEGLELKPEIEATLTAHVPIY